MEPGVRAIVVTKGGTTGRQRATNKAPSNVLVVGFKLPLGQIGVSIREVTVVDTGGEPISPEPPIFTVPSTPKTVTPVIGGITARAATRRDKSLSWSLTGLWTAIGTVDGTGVTGMPFRAFPPGTYRIPSPGGLFVGF